MIVRLCLRDAHSDLDAVFVESSMIIHRLRLVATFQIVPHSKRIGAFIFDQPHVLARLITRALTNAPLIVIESDVAARDVVTSMFGAAQGEETFQRTQKRSDGEVGDQTPGGRKIDGNQSEAGFKHRDPHRLSVLDCKIR